MTAQSNLRTLSRSTLEAMKGDRVEVVVAADDGSRTYEIVATRAGRRVEVTTGRGVVEVVEVTRTGEPVRTARFMASRVVALVEHPASEARATRERSESQSVDAPRSAEDAGGH
jgi:hypothetical protein